MPPRKRTSKARWGPELALWDLDLLIGTVTWLSRGASEDDIREAWELRRDHLLSLEQRELHPGSRPWAWWVFDRGEPAKPRVEDEVARLLELGELTQDEGDRLIAVGEEMMPLAPFVGLPRAVQDANVVLEHRGLPLLTPKVLGGVNPLRVERGGRQPH